MRQFSLFSTQNLTEEAYNGQEYPQEECLFKTNSWVRLWTGDVGQRRHLPLSQKYFLSGKHHANSETLLFFEEVGVANTM